MVGSGRKYDEAGFLKKLGEIEGYIISDVELFPEVPVWVISKEEVEQWHRNGQLGTSTKISGAKAHQLFGHR